LWSEHIAWEEFKAKRAPIERRAITRAMLDTIGMLERDIPEAWHKEQAPIVLAKLEPSAERRALNTDSLGALIAALARESQGARILDNLSESQAKNIASVQIPRLGLPIKASRIRNGDSYSVIIKSEAEPFIELLALEPISERGALTRAELSELVAQAWRAILMASGIGYRSKRLHYSWRESAPASALRVWRAEWSLETKAPILPAPLALGEFASLGEWSRRMVSYRAERYSAERDSSGAIVRRWYTREYLPAFIKAESAIAKAEPKQAPKPKPISQAKRRAFIAKHGEWLESKEALAARHAAISERGCNPACEHVASQAPSTSRAVSKQARRAALRAALWQARERMLVERAWYLAKRESLYLPALESGIEPSKRAALSENISREWLESRAAYKELAKRLRIA
jgi:hypothetical protein